MNNIEGYGAQVGQCVEPVAAENHVVLWESLEALRLLNGRLEGLLDTIQGPMPMPGPDAENEPFEMRLSNVLRQTPLKIEQYASYAQDTISKIEAALFR